MLATDVARLSSNVTSICQCLRTRSRCRPGGILFRSQAGDEIDDLLGGLPVVRVRAGQKTGM